jgi:hypothetical protein
MDKENVIHTWTSIACFLSFVKGRGKQNNDMKVKERLIGR